MDTVVRVATTAKAKLESAKINLETFVAELTQEAITKERYWLNGKPPTAAYCASVIAVIGLDDSSKNAIKHLRNEIVEQERTWQEAKLLLDNMKSRIAVWQTHSANGRKANL